MQNLRKLCNLDDKPTLKFGKQCFTPKNFHQSLLVFELYKITRNHLKALTKSVHFKATAVAL